VSPLTEIGAAARLAFITDADVELVVKKVETADD
jgi:hypothetical protein